MQNLQRITHQVLASAYLCVSFVACGQDHGQPQSMTEVHDASITGMLPSDGAAAQTDADAGSPSAPRDASSPSVLDASVLDAASPHSDASVAQDATSPALDAAPPLDATTPGDATNALPDASNDASSARDAESTTDAALDAALPPDLGVDISLVEISGTLCPKDSWYASISGDKHAVTVTFSQAELQARSAAGVEGSCRLTFDLRVPAGYQFGQAIVAPSGYAFAQRGAANVTLTYAYPAFAAQQTFSHRMVPSDADFVFRDRVDSFWSPTCDAGNAGKPLRLALELTLSATVEAYINLLAVDFDFALQQGNLAFRRCP